MTKIILCKEVVVSKYFWYATYGNHNNYKIRPRLIIKCENHNQSIIFWLSIALRLCPRTKTLSSNIRSLSCFDFSHGKHFRQLQLHSFTIQGIHSKFLTVLYTYVAESSCKNESHRLHAHTNFRLLKWKIKIIESSCIWR